MLFLHEFSDERKEGQKDSSMIMRERKREIMMMRKKRQDVRDSRGHFCSSHESFSFFDFSYCWVTFFWKDEFHVLPLDLTHMRNGQDDPSRLPLSWKVFCDYNLLLFLPLVSRLPCHLP